MRRIPLVLVILSVLVAGVLAAGCGSSGNGEEPGETGIEEKSLVDVPEVVETTQERAGSAARDANLRMIDGAIQAYYYAEGVYPNSINQLVPQYLRSVPVDPLGGVYYIASSGGAAKAAVR